MSSRHQIIMPSLYGTNLEVKNMKNININSIRTLTHISPNLVTHFCKAAARLSGKIALREQFNIEHEEGSCSSMAMAEVDIEALQSSIANLARLCAKTLWRLNEIAKDSGFKQPLYGVNEMSLSEVIESVTAYVTALVGESDYRDWVNDYDE